MRATEFLTEDYKGFTQQDFGFDKEDDIGVTMNHLQVIADTLRRDCAPYIATNKLWLKEGNNLYRGVKEANRQEDFFIKGIVRADRNPRDTPRRWHDFFNTFFQREFGHPYRSDSMFVFTKEYDTNDFGAPYAVFPIGDYTICYSPLISDLTTDFTDPSMSMTPFNAVLRNMSFADIKSANERYGFDWQTHGEIADTYLRVIRGQSTNEGEAFSEFLMEYILPRLGYEETYDANNIGRSEAMVKCSGYYGVMVSGMHGVNSNKAVKELMSMVLA